MTAEKERAQHFIQEIVERDCRARRWGTWPDGTPKVRTRFPPEPNGYLHIGHAKSICLNFGLAEQYGGKCNLRFDDTNPVKEEEEFVQSIIDNVRWLGFRWPGASDDEGGDPNQSRDREEAPQASRDREGAVAKETARSPAQPLADGRGSDHAASAKAGVLFASDYFQQMYDWAAELIRKGLAYVDDQTAEQIRQSRGTLTRPGANSPHRDRPIAESLDLFEKMKRGDFPDGSKVLRAKIDMAHANLNLRDPVMYRVLHAAHHRTGEAWCIYPMYDWAHGLEDSIEGITHSICTLEFENHRPLYDWFIDAINQGRTEDGAGPAGRKIDHPRQIEFARLELTHTVMSKRRLAELVRAGQAGSLPHPGDASRSQAGAASGAASVGPGLRHPIRGWDDPRMPTLAGLRRRGYTPEAIRAFCADIGVAKFNSVIEVVRLENAVREHLNRTAPRVMAVLRPLRVVIENWPEEGSHEATKPRSHEGENAERSSDREIERSSQDAGAGQSKTQNPKSRIDPGRVEWLDAVNNPEDSSAGTRRVPFSRVLYIERDDFMEDPPRKFFRLAPGREVRLRYGYFITCREAVKNDAGEVVELRCTYDPATRGGDAPDGRKVKATLHWVSAAHALAAEVRLYDHLFTNPDPDDVPEGGSYLDNLNPESLEIVHPAYVEPSVADAGPGERFQFERLGYFCVDPDTTPERLVFNRTVSLRDAWAKVAGKQ
jgi:glutaminyl-tRNA synthetase